MSEEILDKELVHEKQRLENSITKMQLLQAGFLWFNKLKEKSITQDQIVDTAEHEIEQYLFKKPKPTLTLKPGGK